MKPDWFPDWSDRVCAIVASGPTTKHANLNQLRGRVAVLAIKESAYELCPWADVAYGCDAAWWVHRRGLQNFKGIKVAWSGARMNFSDIRRIDIVDDKRMVFDRPGTVAGGGNSGYQAVNMAAQFGSRRILLVGFDMHDRGGVHWYGRNNWYKGGNPDESCFQRWRQAFDVAAVDLAAMSVEVINTSPSSHLKSFRKQPLEGALARWGV